MKVAIVAFLLMLVVLAGANARRFFPRNNAAEMLEKDGELCIDLLHSILVIRLYRTLDLKSSVSSFSK